MAIIKKGIKVGDSTYVNKVMIGDQTVYKVWSGTADLPKSKLIYYYNPTGTQGLSYSKSESGLQVSGIGSVTDTSIVVPSETYEYGDKNTIYTVNKIGDNAFKNANVGEVNLPTTVTEIGAYAFINTTPSTLTINGLQNIKTLAGGAFESSKISNANLTNISVIPNYCFAHSNIKTYDFGSGVTSIGDHAFDGCENLTGFADLKATSVGEHCFRDSDISHIELPNITSIPAYCFYGTQLMAGNIGYENYSSTMINIDVESIGDYAFANIHSKTGSFTIYPEGSTFKQITIGDYAFFSANVQFVGNLFTMVKKYGKYAFAESAIYGGLISPPSGIGIIDIPEGFAMNSLVYNIHFADGVESIGKDAFYGCNNLESAEFDVATNWWQVQNDGTQKRVDVSDKKTAAELLKSGKKLIHK